MQVDLMGPPPSSPYRNFLTAIDVFSKYLFAVSLTTISALSVAKRTCFYYAPTQLPTTKIIQIWEHNLYQNYYTN